VKQVTLQGSVENDFPWSFEAGTPNIEGAIALTAAIEFIERLGWEWIDRHKRELLSHAIRGLAEIPGIKLIGPPAAHARRCSAVSFVHHGIEAHAIARMLSDRQNVMVRSGLHCAHPLHDQLGVGATVRCSFSVYNTTEEIDVMLRVISSMNALLGSMPSNLGSIEH
jgi:cysteine desulfurase/selenocysteine lyase